MADRGIVFTAPMIRALRAGIKTQTRRLLSPQPTPACESFQRVFATPPYFEARDRNGSPLYAFPDKHGLTPFPTINVGVGDRLWVREGWYTWGAFDDLKPSALTGREGVSYEVDRPADQPRPGRYRSARFMPRWASRMTLIVTDVRVQRVTETSKADCVAEGHPRPDHELLRQLDEQVHLDAARDWYMDLWDAIHDEDGKRWRDAPWIVAYTFGVRHGNVDA